MGIPVDCSRVIGVLFTISAISRKMLCIFSVTNSPSVHVFSTTGILATRIHQLKHLARKILREYSPYFLDQLIVIVAASTVVAYSLYTMSPDVTAKLQTTRLNLTIPFVLYGIFRYLYLVHQKEKGGSPARILLTDKPLLIDIVLWLMTAFLILYL